MGNIDLHFFDHLVMFFIGIVMPVMAVMSARQGLEGLKITPKVKKSIYWSNSLFLWFGLMIVLAVWLFNGRSLSDLGIREPIENAPRLWWLLFISFIVLYVGDTLAQLLFHKKRKATIERWKKYTPYMPAKWDEFLWFLLVAFSAGICEEVVYRGYMINYLLAALKHQNSAVVYSVMIPAIIFGVAHIYQGSKAVLKIVVMAMLFGYIFILTQSILLLIIVHIMVDVIGGFLGMYLLPVNEAGSSGEEEE